ncbi:MAG: dihydrolipoyl dehydrogenase [Planctomycetota bacterium]|nr:dihydrolipoyl dehydrogenase [Planctomycetota bacterium]
MSGVRVAVIGAGPAGYVAALRAAQLGAKVTVVDRDEVGGVCLNRGCIPTKALLASVNAAARSREGRRLGVEFGPVRADLKAMMREKEKIIVGLRRGIELLLKKNHIESVRGVAHFKSPREIEIVRSNGASELLNADRAIIASGSGHVLVPGLGGEADIPADVRRAFLTSDDCLEMAEVPGSLVVVGAGPIGLEFAYLFALLGSAVTVVEMAPSILPSEDAEVAAELERQLKKLKIKIRTGTRIERAGTGADSVAEVVLSGGEKIAAAAVLVAVGRRPDCAGLGAQGIGIAVEKGGRIGVTDKMETSAGGVYAAGDVVGGLMLAHKAYAEGVVAAENALGGDSRMDYRAIPRCVHTEPQVASVGLCMKDAEARGIGCKAGVFPFRGLGMGHAGRKTAGLVKVVAETGTGKLLGVQIVGESACEMIHEAVLAVRLGLRASELYSTIHAHPSMSEAVAEAALALEGRALHL